MPQFHPFCQILSKVQYERILAETSHQTPGKWSFKEQGEVIISQSPLLVSIDDDFTAREELDLNKRYAEGLSAMYQENWDNAIQKFEVVLERNPDFPNIKEKIQEAERNNQNEDLYLQAVLDIESGRFEEAKTKILEIQASQTEYKNMDKLLAHVNARLMEKEPQEGLQDLESSVQREVVREIPELDDQWKKANLRRENPDWRI
jgi:tetratricopeptide (TPR) repeat protein